MTAEKDPCETCSWAASCSPKSCISKISYLRKQGRNEPKEEKFTMITTDRFNRVVAEQLKRSTDVLCTKATEYATEDRLHNFKVAAAVQGNTPFEALAGMMAKHTVSVYDMLRDSGTGKRFPVALWDEKITDSINYLLLLRAMVEEQEGG